MIALIILLILCFIAIYGAVDMFKQISKIKDVPDSGSYDDLLKYRRGKSKN
jgi:hypothetical protein